jgi:hypothetical protein
MTFCTRKSNTLLCQLFSVARTLMDELDIFDFFDKSLIVAVNCVPHPFVLQHQYCYF